MDQSRSPQSEKSAQKDSSRHPTTSGRKDNTKYKLLYVSKRRGPAQDSSSTSDGLNNLGGSGKCVVSTKSCPPTQSTTTQNGSPPKHNKNADEFQFRSAQQTVERGVISAEKKSNSKGNKSRQRRNIILKGFSKKAQNTNQFPNSNNGAESIL